MREGVDGNKRTSRAAVDEAVVMCSSWRVHSVIVIALTATDVSTTCAVEAIS